MFFSDKKFWPVLKSVLRLKAKSTFFFKNRCQLILNIQKNGTLLSFVLLTYEQHYLTITAITRIITGRR